MITFEHPIWLLLFIPLLWLFFSLALYKKRPYGLVWSFKIWKHKSPSLGPFWPLVFVYLAHLTWGTLLVCLVLILSKPQRITKEKFYLTNGAAIMIVLDVSPSMAAHDMQKESRFELAQKAIHRFISSRENDMLGLITFGREAAIRAPLTKDRQFLHDTINRTKILEHGDGTSIGTALALAGLHLQGNPAKQKSIILITDGDNNSGEIHPDAAIDILTTLRIKAFVIGLGQLQNNNVIVEDPYTHEKYQGFIQNAYNESLLQHIAHCTLGHFFRAESLVTFDSLFQMVDSQSTSEKTFKLIPVVKDYKDSLFYLALLCYTIHILIRFAILREAL